MKKLTDLYYYLQLRLWAFCSQPVAVIRAKKKERLTLPPWIPT